MADDKPIIVVKKKGHHGGHHGGAWKVAYADFVTAMMAFFMVMWLVNTADQTTKQAIAVYFRKPGIFETGSGAPLMVGQSGIIHEAISVGKVSSTTTKPGNTGTPAPETQTHVDIPNSRLLPYTVKGSEEQGRGESGSGDIGKNDAGAERAGINPANDEEEEEIEAVKKKLKQQLGLMPELEVLLGQVEVTIEPDGIKIEIADTEKVSMFASGSARIIPDAESAFDKIAEIVKKVPYPLDIIGHTDAKPFSNLYATYSNWELSADRANAARRRLEQAGVDPKRITRVLGMADRDLKNSSDPLAASNRRITMKLRIPQNPDAKKNKPFNPNLNAIGQGTISQPTTTSAGVGASSTSSKAAVPDEQVKAPKKGKAGQTISEQRENIFSDNPVLGPSSVFDGL